jgi:hypothetical protein
LGKGQIDPSAMSRGTTYWIAAGDYGSPHFSTPDNGTLTITVEAATNGNSGPATDWKRTYAGVAGFGADTAVTTDYWTFNGQAWPSPCSGLPACGVTGFTLYFHNTTDGSASGASLSVTGSDVRVQYAEIEGINDGSSDDVGINTNCSANLVNNFYLGYSYIHDVGVDLFAGQYFCGANNYTGSNYIFEHNMFAHNHRGDVHQHAQAIATGAQNLVVRYNTFYDIGSSGVVTDPFAGFPTLSNWYVYANTVYWDKSFTAGIGDGLVGLFGETFSGNLYIVNNTMANINSPACAASGFACNSFALFVCDSTSSCGLNNTCGTSSDCGNPIVVVANNLWYDPSAAQGVYQSGRNIAWNPTTNDFNQAYCPSSGCSYGGSFTAQGSHDLQSNTGNPFVNFDGQSNFNVSLLGHTSAGTPAYISSPQGCTANLNCIGTDPLGVARGTGGVWDRGAFQVSGIPSPNPPASLSAIVQ